MPPVTFKLVAVLLAGGIVIPQAASATPIAPAIAAHARTSAPATPSLLTNGSFDATGPQWASPWLLQVTSTAQARMAQDSTTAADGPSSAAITVVRATPGANAWFTALIQGGLSLQAGATYNLAFWAKSSSVRNIDAGIQQQISPYQWRVFRTYTVSTTWQLYAVSFVAPVSEAPVKVQFNLGQAQGTVRIDGVTLTSSGGQAAQATVPPSATATAAPPTATSAPATATYTATAVPSTATPAGTATAGPPTGTATAPPPSATATMTATPVPPSATPAGGAADPSGQPIPVGDLPGWHQAFADDFTTNVPVGSFPGVVYGSKWTAYQDGQKDTTGNGRYYPSRVLSVNNGMLNLYLHTENGVHMVAAPVPIILPGRPYAGMLYGRYTVRFRADSVTGYKTAWLLWPDSGIWPGDGEIDFPEANLDTTINAFMHWQGGTSYMSFDAYHANTTYGAWHTATTEWTPSAVTFYMDGQVVGRSTSRIPNTPMHWVIQTETSTDGTVPSDTTAGNVQIDWVAAYSYQP